MLGPSASADHVPRPTAPPAFGPGRLWDVYFMRHSGRRLEREYARASVRRGLLWIDTATTTRARLQSPSGVEFGTLDAVCLRRLLPSGQMLLQGIEVKHNRRGVYEYPQAWWCIPV